MPIRRIKVIDYRKNLIGWIERDMPLILLPQDGVKFSLKDVDNLALAKYTQMDIAIGDSCKYLNQAAEELGKKPVVESLAGCRPLSDGEFGISGDKCLSWKAEELTGAESIRTEFRHRVYFDDRPAYLYVDGLGIDYESYEAMIVAIMQRKSTGQYSPKLNYCDIYTPRKPGKLTLTDLCPTCVKCSDTFLLIKRIEWCKIMLNALKDASLYADATFKSRLAYLNGRRAAVSANCSKLLEDPSSSVFGKDPEVVAMELLTQYAALVHMWNYAVTQNNCSTEIHTASEDSSGFYVQTKRSLPSCKGKATLNCEIAVTASGAGQDKLSMLVVKPTADFMPFSMGTVPEPVVRHNGALDKVVTTSFSAASVAGTYALTAKFLPFRYTVMKTGDGTELNVQDYLANVDWDDIPTTPHGESADQAEGESIDIDGKGESSVIIAPTEEQYNASKTYPSHSVPGKNRWQVKITWKMQLGDIDKEWSETYFYETNKVREEIVGILRKSDLDAIVDDEGNKVKPKDVPQASDSGK